MRTAWNGTLSAAALTVATLGLAVHTAAAARARAAEPSVPAGPQSVSAPVIEDSESYAIFAILVSDRTAIGMRATTAVVQAETAVDPRCWPSGPPLEKDWRVPADALRSANQEPHLIGVRVSAPYSVVSKADIRSAFGDNLLDGWKHFYERYAKSSGYFWFSVVGFDANRAKAIVYVGHAYGILGGEYSYHFLQKAEHGWVDVQLPGVNTCLMVS